MFAKNESGFQLIELLIVLALLVMLLACTLQYTSFGYLLNTQRSAKELVSFLHGARLLALESGETLDLIQPEPNILTLQKRSTGETLHTYYCNRCTLIPKYFAKTLPSFEPNRSVFKNGHFEIIGTYSTSSCCVTINKLGRARINIECKSQ